MSENIKMDPEKFIDYMKNLVNGANAYSRVDKIPIQVWPKSAKQNNTTSGEYVNFGRNDKDEKISLYPNALASPTSSMDALKHELVHHILNSIKTPTIQDYQNKFKNVSRDNSFLGNLFSEPLANAGPSTLWRWDDNNRAGNFRDELPAYMSIYNPKELNTVSQAQRDQYMKDLFLYLNNNGWDRQGNKIKNIIKGREAYNGTSLLPEK